MASTVPEVCSEQPVKIDDDKHMEEKETQRSEEDLKVKPPDGGYGWLIVIGAAITHFFLVGMARCLGVVYIELKQKYGGTDVQTAWVAAIFNTCRSLFAPVASFFCERLSCRIVTLAGAAVLTIGFLCSAFATSLFHLYITFGLAGVGGAMVFTPAYIMVGKYFEKRKGKAMSFATLGSGLGSIVLAPAINALLHFYTFFGTMFIVAGLELHHAIAGIIYIPFHQKKALVEMQDVVIKQSSAGDKSETDPDGEIESVGKTPKQTEIVLSQKPLLEEMSQDKKNKSNSNHLEKTTFSMKISRMRKDSLFCNGTFFLYGIVIMSMQVCIQTYLIFLPGFALEKRATDREAALVLSIFGFCDMGGRFLFGFLFDLKPIRNNRRDFFCIVSSLFGALVILTSFMSSLILVCVLAGLTGIFEGATHSQRTTVLSEFVTASQMSTSVGVIIFFQGLGNIYGPPLGGLLSDITGTNAYAFIFCGSMMLVSSLIFLLQNWLCNRRCQQS